MARVASLAFRASCSWHVLAQKSFQLARKRTGLIPVTLFFCNLNFLKNFLYSFGKVNRIHCPDSKIHWRQPRAIGQYVLSIRMLLIRCSELKLNYFFKFLFFFCLCQIVSMLDMIRNSIKNTPEAAALFYDELARIVQLGGIDPKIEVHSNLL